MQVGVLGAPGGDRTPDPRLRSPPLYPTELRAHESERHPTLDFLSDLLPQELMLPSGIEPDITRVKVWALDQFVLGSANVMVLSTGLEPVFRP